ncbi:MAG: NAD(P)/FAD-dependent oxidoreductase [Candidatus Peribacteria bacterium]|nr:NAD(P)/FAD-dependent oxidoreductase [Candidatus Peribacteria bacterium]
MTKPRGFEESKVCGGGIHTSNLTSNFELKTVSGLYIIGECLNVTGKT